MTNVDQEFQDLLLTKSLETIKKQSTQSSARLTLYNQLFTLEALHTFCCSVDMFLQEYEQPQGVHFQLNERGIAGIVDRLRWLGLWEIYVQDVPLEMTIDHLSNSTIPLLNQEEGSYCDIVDCGYCWQKHTYRINMKKQK